jgi:hypothetical protein
MTAIGELTMNSYALPYRLGANASQSAQAAATSLPASTGAGLVSGEASAFKLSAALWDLTSSEDASAKDGDPWAGSGSYGSAAEQEFLALANMDLGEMIRAKYLSEKDLTEEDLASMPVEEREATESEIREAVLRGIGVDPDHADKAEAQRAPATLSA